MPAVTERNKRYIRAKRRTDSLGAYISEIADHAGKKQSDIAPQLGISQQAYSKALKKMSFSTIQLFVILDYLQADPEEIKNIMERWKQHA